MSATEQPSLVEKLGPPSGRTLAIDLGRNPTKVTPVRSDETGAVVGLQREHKSGRVDAKAVAPPVIWRVRDHDPETNAIVIAAAITLNEMHGRRLVARAPGTEGTPLRFSRDIVRHLERILGRRYRAGGT